MSPAGWLPVHRDQLRAQRSVTSMGKLHLLPFSCQNGNNLSSTEMVVSFRYVTLWVTDVMPIFRNRLLFAVFCLQCFDTIGWASKRASGLQKLRDEVLEWLSVWSKVQIVCLWSDWCHCIPKPHHLLPHCNPDWFSLSATSLPSLSRKRGHYTGMVVV